MYLTKNSTCLKSQSVFFFSHYFIVVQVQLSAFTTHHSPQQKFDANLIYLQTFKSHYGVFYKDTISIHYSSK